MHAYLYTCLGPLMRLISLSIVPLLHQYADICIKKKSRVEFDIEGEERTFCGAVIVLQFHRCWAATRHLHLHSVSA